MTKKIVTWADVEDTISSPTFMQRLHKIFHPAPHPNQIRGVKLKRTIREIAAEAEQGSWGQGPEYA